MSLNGWHWLEENVTRRSWTPALCYIIKFYQKYACIPTYVLTDSEIEVLSTIVQDLDGILQDLIR